MNRIKHISMAAKEFAHDNKDLLVIIADPKTDTLFAAYNDSMTFGAIKNVKTGMRKNIVKEVLMYSKFNKSLTGFQSFKFLADMFIINLVEFLWLPINRGSVHEFYKFVSDALFYVPKGSKYKVEEPAVEEKVTLDDVLENAEIKK